MNDHSKVIRSKERIGSTLSDLPERTSGWRRVFHEIPAKFVCQCKVCFFSFFLMFHHKNQVYDILESKYLSICVIQNTDRFWTQHHWAHQDLGVLHTKTMSAHLRLCSGVLGQGTSWSTPGTNTAGCPASVCHFAWEETDTWQKNCAARWAESCGMILLNICRVYLAMWLLRLYAPQERMITLLVAGNRSLGVCGRVLPQRSYLPTDTWLMIMILTDEVREAIRVEKRRKLVRMSQREFSSCTPNLKSVMVYRHVIFLVVIINTYSRFFWKMIRTLRFKWCSDGGEGL